MNKLNSYILDLIESYKNGNLLPEKLIKDSYSKLYKDKHNIVSHIFEDIIPSKNLELPLCNIPCGIKANIAFNSNAPCDCRLLQNSYQKNNSVLAERLENSGAKILAQLAMDELAIGSDGTYSAIHNSLHPFDKGLTPGGSSSGSAIAVADNSFLFTFGTDTGGSVRRPAAFMGIVGFKPTYGRIPRFGVTTHASSLDTVGIYSKSVYDCAMVANSVFGYSPLDQTSYKEPYNIYNKSFTENITNNSGFKIGIINNLLADDFDKEFFNSISQNNIEIEYLSFPEELISLFKSIYYTLASIETVATLSRFDGYHYKPSNSHKLKSKSAMEFAKLATDIRTEYLGPLVKKRLMIGAFMLDIGEDYVKKAYALRTVISDYFTKLFSRYDILLTSSNYLPPNKLGVNNNNPQLDDDRLLLSPSLARLPAISIPKRLFNYMSTSYQLIADYGKDRELLNCAYLLENMLLKWGDK